MDVIEAMRHQSRDVCAECWAPLLALRNPDRTYRAECSNDKAHTGTVSRTSVERRRVQAREELRRNREKMEQYQTDVIRQYQEG